MALSAPHYGIHGTNKPETIGYATSSGCVRLTNWDAQFLSRHISRGVPVHFRDIQGRTGGQAYGDQGMTSGGPDSGRATASGARVDSAASAASGEAKGGTHGTPSRRGSSGGSDSGSSSTRRGSSTRDTAKSR
jgi:hypothetical protein